MIILSTEVYTFRVVNKAFSKRRRAKKARIYKKSIFIIEDIQDFLLQKNIKE